jgi:hypothetical protein
MKVAISRSRYGDKRNEPRWKKTGRASENTKIGMSGEILWLCFFGTAAARRPEGSVLPTSRDALAAMLVTRFHPVSVSTAGA